MLIRDLRLRQYLRERYDSIPNVFDWDFHMKLADKGVTVDLLWSVVFTVTGTQSSVCDSVVN